MLVLFFFGHSSIKLLILLMILDVVTFPELVLLDMYRTAVHLRHKKSFENIILMELAHFVTTKWLIIYENSET